MKKFIVLMAFVMSIFVVPAFANDGAVKKVPTATSGYVKKDKAYWTRVWYEKQAKRKARGKKSYTSKRYRKSSKKRTRYSKRRTKRRGSRGAGVVAKVDLSSQRMRVYKNGVHQYTWKVSSGRAGYGTPTGSWSIKRMHKRYFSKKYHGAPMPYAMFYNGGFAVHGTGSIKRLGRRASHGCVRLHPSNAARLFSMVRQSGGRVVVTY